MSARKYTETALVKWFTRQRLNKVAIGEVQKEKPKLNNEHQFTSSNSWVDKREKRRNECSAKAVSRRVQHCFVRNLNEL